MRVGQHSSEKETMTFDEEIVQAVWQKGRAMSDRNPSEWRKDQCGAWIRRDQFENTHSEFGWKILKVVAGGGNDPGSLQPFQRENSFDIENGRPQCRVTADRTDFAPGQSVDQPRNRTE